MRGRRFILFAGLLALAACSTRHATQWSPFVAPRSEEWHSGRMMIANYDTDADGTVTRAELESGLRQYFKQADTNHDGRLDPDEVAAANQRRIQKDGSAAIPLIDWNHDGYVDFNEFARARARNSSCWTRMATARSRRKNFVTRRPSGAAFSLGNRRLCLTATEPPPYTGPLSRNGPSGPDAGA